MFQSSNFVTFTTKYGKILYKFSRFKKTRYSFVEKGKTSIGGLLNMSNNRYHRAFGVYGIYVEGGKLLVINKKGSPYKNRFDLPGGSLKDGETLSEAIQREFLEETGLEIEIEENIGVIDFKLPWL
jgi:hypothetical protein